MFSCSCLVQLPASFLATGPLTSQAQANRHLLDSSFSLTGPAQLILRGHVSGKQLKTQRQIMCVFQQSLNHVSTELLILLLCWWVPET